MQSAGAVRHGSESRHIAEWIGAAYMTDRYGTVWSVGRDQEHDDRTTTNQALPTACCPRACSLVSLSGTKVRVAIVDWDRLELDSADAGLPVPPTFMLDSLALMRLYPIRLIDCRR